MAYAAVETWDLTADAFPVGLDLYRRGVRTPIQGGLVQRRQTFSSESAQGQAAVRTFRLLFNTATKSDDNRAVALWKNTTGGTQGITYEHTNTAYSGTETIIVRMVAAPFLLRKVAHGRYQFTVVLEEMLHAP